MDTLPAPVIQTSEFRAPVRVAPPSLRIVLGVVSGATLVMGWDARLEASLAVAVLWLAYFWGTNRLHTARLDEIRTGLRDALQTRDLHEERFLAAVEAAPSSMIVCDRHGVIRHANARTGPLFGWPVTDLPGSPIGRLIPGSPLDEYETGDEADAGQSPSPSSPSSAPLEAHRRDGTTFPVEVDVTPLPSHDEPLFLTAVTDITRQRSAERTADEAAASLQVKLAELQESNAELRRSNEALEQFAYVASHDLQEPLRMVSSYTELLSRRYADQIDDEGREMVGYAVRGAQRMKALIDGLLEYSRVSRARGEPTAVDANAACDAVLDGYRRQIEETGATVTRGELPTVHIDPVELELVFRNLVGNALKFTEDPTETVVRITAERSGQRWCFSVEDNGIGVDEQFAEKAFQIFQRLQPRGRYAGVGMGLTMCQAIVRRAGGRIWIESSALGGARFRFTLPATPGSSCPPPRQPASVADERTAERSHHPDSEAWPTP